MLRCISFFLIFFFSEWTFAFKVEPMVAEIEPLGSRSQLSMRIDNTSDKPLTVELHPYSFTMDENGIETRAPADDDLLVIPATAMIQPGKSQSVLVRYLGDPAISQSKAYRITVKQVKVNRPGGNAGTMGLLLQFTTLLNVKPKFTNSDLRIGEFIDMGSDWRVEVLNSGDSYGRLTNSHLIVSDGIRRKEIKGTEISKYFAGTLILPHSKRIFTMKPMEGFLGEKVSMQIKGK